MSVNNKQWLSKKSPKSVAVIRVKNKFIYYKPTVNNELWPLINFYFKVLILNKE